MSRFINFASNLLDGVDSIAKDSLTDQDLAAAAAERRRSRRRRKEVYGGSSAAEQSEGGLSEDGSHYDAPGVRQHGQEETTPSKGAEHFGAAGGAASTADADGDFVEGAGRQVQASVAAVYENETGAAAAAVAAAASALTPSKEDGGVWSDPDGFSSTAPSRSSHGRESAGGGINDPPWASASTSTARDSRRPPRLQGNFLDPARGPADVERDDGDSEGGDNETVELYVGEVEEGSARAPSFADGSSVSNASMRVNASLSPAMSPLPLHQDHRHRRGLVAEALGGDGDRSDGGGAMIETASGVDRVGTGHGTSGMKDSAGVVMRSAPGVTVGSDLKGNSSASDAGGRERRGFGNLLGMGGRRAGRSVAEEDMEALKAEAAELREEVEDLSLELEDAEDRLRGQELELQAAGEEMKRQRVETQHREGEMEREMEEFRALQAEEKKLFLANLGEAEKKLKDKERQAEETRSALSALEAFAMEREDAAARLKHEKEELLEELKGVRSGQDRSAEELREALTRAEREKEEAESRHRVWMRQAQARQTELEATATQLADALAKAKRRQEGSRGGEGGGTRAEGARGSSYSSDRELRAARDELESCQASLELEQERSRALQQEVTALLHDLDAARATEAVTEKQRQEHANMAADAFAKVSRLEQQLQQEKVFAQRIGAAASTPAGTESQVQSLSSKLLDKQARLEESVRERATLSVKLKEALGRANRAEQELWEARGDSLEAGDDVGAPGMRSRRRLGVSGRTSGGAAWSRLAPIAKHKKIATAVDIVDRRTLQAVVFLRNSSMARAFFLGYLLLLHLLAFVILAFHSSKMEPTKGPQPPTGPNGATG